MILMRPFQLSYSMILGFYDPAHDHTKHQKQFLGGKSMQVLWDNFLKYETVSQILHAAWI